MKKHPLAEQYIKEIKAAMKMFGSYSYYDKGPDEVMKVNWKPLIKLSQQERVQVLKELLAFKDGQPLAYAIVSELQDADEVSEEEWGELDEMVL